MTPEAQVVPISNLLGAVTSKAQEGTPSNIPGAVTPEALIQKPIDELDKIIPLHEIVKHPKVTQPQRKQCSRKRHSIIAMIYILEGKEPKRKKTVKTMN